MWLRSDILLVRPCNAARYVVRSPVPTVLHGSVSRYAGTATRRSMERVEAARGKPWTHRTDLHNAKARPRREDDQARPRCGPQEMDRRRDNRGGTSKPGEFGLPSLQGQRRQVRGL